MKVTNYQNATIDPFGKGLGMVPGTSIQLNDASRLQWNLLEEDVSLPAAVLYSDRIEHNLKWMQAFVGEYGVKLAPHGKTTMAPQLFRRQLDTGAWGITLATAHQVRAAYRGGVHRILMANQLVGKRNMGMIAELLTDANFEFFCLVDSADGVDQLGEFFSSVRKKLNVLIELGVPGGRTGVRDDAQRDAVLAAIARWQGTIELAGIELYEGVLQDETKVREFLKSAVDVTRKLIADGKIARKPAILSGAGSAWYDVVADEFAKANSDAIEVVLRPGCYLTHDVGIYKKAQNEIFARNPIAKKMGQGLKPALQLWAYVQSIRNRTARSSGSASAIPRSMRACPSRRSISVRATRRRATCRPTKAGNLRPDGSARVPAHQARRRSESGRHDRVRHLASVPDVRQVASDSRRRSEVSRH